ncbi:MAG: OmpA family protein [Gammaproteobacteria bacterium]|nr:OmpA family protein [Gammaproteobacteria bacterium]MDH5303415.1 OmpA family protein [Gammaproteobacteria bacterium]MDH5322494.1 OmpA family protein [Gammaproteobacteria bacterium]
MNMKRLSCYWLTWLVSLATAPVLAADVTEEALGEVVERQLDVDVGVTQWVQDPDRIAAEQGDTLELRETVNDALETIKLANLVAPIRFESGVADIPASTVESLGAILERMQDRLNVRLHLIGHADNQPLSPRLVEIYGDNAGLSRERAGEVAEYFQTVLALPPEAVSYEWFGETRPVASNATAAGRALNRRVEVEVWYDEPREKVALEEFLVPHEIQRVKVCRMETVCKLRYVDGHAKRARLQNLVAPLHYDEDTIDVDEVFVERVRQGLQNLADKQNVMIKFVGYTDDAPLLGRTERIYGDHIGLSKARARRVALAVQDELNISTEMIDSDGRGATRPLGSSATPNGRALNRRVEVEFWYDDPLADLPDEPQLCPEDAGAEIVTRVYDPPWGQISNIEFTDGQPVIPAGYAATLARGLADVADKTNPRLRFIGYTRNERLERRTATVYGDDIGLSASRARRAMQLLVDEMQLDENQAEFEGHGYVHSADVINVGFVQGETSHVAVQVVYDELAILDDYEGVDITRITREITAANPLGLNLMRITVDGKPIDDPKRSSSDIQRCTDVALEKVDIQFGFDNLRSAPRLSVAAEPSFIELSPHVESGPIFGQGEFFIGKKASPVSFRMYTNYAHFIERAEVRVFEKGRSIEAQPLAVVAVEADAIATWQPPPAVVDGPLYELAYVLRAYGTDGSFDETEPLPLWVVNEDGKEIPLPTEPLPTEPLAAEPPAEPQVHSAYGENRLRMHNIGLSSGTVSVRGSGISEAQQVWVAGRPIPVDISGNFVSEEILPEGAHTVEVAVLDEDGGGELYLRDFEFKPKDWFYVGMADLTLSQGSSNGPIELLQGENSDYDYDSNTDGRLAFFVNGKFGDHWKLTASADTREGSLDSLFSNFMDKSPQAFFRRIDPDYYYPTFGDDGTVAEMAPTMGKLFVRLGKGDDYGQWGNFKIAYMQNELAQVDRGLYGANLHYQSEGATTFGDRRLVANAFAAEPGTIGNREEFRGTGGSLYFLQQQDILAGSESVRIELRDKASGIVTGVVNLTPAMDYDIDYLQGRILLAQPLAATSDDGLLVRSGSVSGDEAYLVVRYEYTPGFGDIEALATGGQLHYWLGDYVKVGVTTNLNEQDDTDSSLNAADVTLRWSAGSWVKLQQAQSEGLVSLATTSVDGGFEFDSYDPASFVDAEAASHRADISVDLGDFVDFTDGKLSVYVQEADAGFSAPGQLALTDTRNYGGALTLPFGSRFSLGAKFDNRTQEQGVDTQAQEYNLGYRFTENWDLKAGYRKDERLDNSIIVPLTQEQGERSDAVLQVGYDSRSTWNTHLFVQDTLSVTGDREENGRVGIGGSYRMSDKLRIDAEVSDGDLGKGGKLGTNYLHSERTSLYLNYALENERTDNAMRIIRGSQGNLVTGVKTRLADSTSVYLEERFQQSESMTGLTHATGVNFVPNVKWRFGFTSDIGTLQDTQTGANTDRLAGGVQVGYNTGSLQFASGIEYRNDEAEQLDLSSNERETWLFRSNFKYQINPAARLLGKLNYSESTSSLGTFYDGGYTEAVLGYAYRPVSNDRLNTLVKYTYFYNVPTTEQIGLQSLATTFIQKSHIAAVDVTYDLTSSVTLGGKYAYRLSQTSLDRENLEFFDNNASLFVLRGDYRFRKNWEVLLEARMLQMADLDERRSGALATLSRYIGDHLKVGLGYNFTDFSDDLTDLSYDHHGVFLSLTGTM